MTEEIVHRDKHVARMAAALMLPLAFITLVATVAVAAGADPAAPRLAALIPFAGFLWTAWTILTRTVVRTAVSRDEVQVDWGLDRHRIPLKAITVCEAKAVSGGPTAATGAGWALFANHGSVLLTWVEGGATKSLLFPANDPPMLAEQINATRDRGAPTSVRVKDDAATAEVAVAEAAPSASATERRE